MKIWERFLRIFRKDKIIGTVEKKEILVYDPIQASLEKDIEKKREAIQSYILTSAKYNFSEYEKKILLRLIEGFQFQLEGQKLEAEFSIAQNQYGDVDVILPISSLTVGEDLTEWNYDQLKKSLYSLMNRRVCYEDKGNWTSVALIERPEISGDRDNLQFRLPLRVREALMAFSSGYHREELDEVLLFRSIYAQRFHEILKGISTPVRYSIDELKAMFQLEKKYKHIRIFIPRVIERAKKELDTKGSFSFTYQLEYEKERKQRGRKRIIAIIFTPTYPSAQHLEKSVEEQEPESVVPESIITSTEADSSVELIQTNQRDKEQEDNKETVIDRRQRASVRSFLEDILSFSGKELEELTDLVLTKGGGKYLTHLFRTCNRDVEVTIEKLKQLKTDNSSAPVSEITKAAEG